MDWMRFFGQFVMCWFIGAALGEGVFWIARKQGVSVRARKIIVIVGVAALECVLLLSPLVMPEAAIIGGIFALLYLLVWPHKP